MLANETRIPAASLVALREKETAKSNATTRSKRVKAKWKLKSQDGRDVFLSFGRNDILKNDSGLS